MNLNLNLGQILVGMLYEDGQISFTRVISLLLILLFSFVTMYLVYTGTVWGSYETFANLTAGGGAVTQLVNKFVNSKYNSPIGVPPTVSTKKEDEI